MKKFMYKMKKWSVEFIKDLKLFIALSAALRKEIRFAAELVIIKINERDNFRKQFIEQQNTKIALLLQKKDQE